MTEGRSQQIPSPSVFPSVRHSVQQIGAAGLEPATSCSRSRRATGLRYAPRKAVAKGALPPYRPSFRPFVTFKVVASLACW